MKRFLKYLRYDWPVYFILLLTNWLPDNVIFLKIRGFLISPFLGSCKGNLRVGRHVVIQNPSKIHLGQHVHIGYGTIFLPAADINIGSFVSIAPYCVIVSSNHVRINGSFSNDELESSPINIMENTWLGAHVVITAGSMIASGSCVGAGAVTSGKYEVPALIGGVPAKVIKIFDQQIKDR